MHRPILISLLLVSLAACDASRFSTAKRADTVQAYRRFLVLSPDSEHAPAARQRLEALEYRRARAADKVIGYRMFLDQFPEGRYAADCQARMARTALDQARTPAAQEPPPDRRASAPTEPDPIDEVDLTDLVDAPDHEEQLLEKLSQAFPGSELLPTEQDDQND